jgi:hypothetical protein
MAALGGRSGRGDDGTALAVVQMLIGVLTWVGWMGVLEDAIEDTVPDDWDSRPLPQHHVDPMYAQARQAIDQECHPVRKEAEASGALDLATNRGTARTTPNASHGNILGFRV